MKCELCASTGSVKDFDVGGRGILIIPVCSCCFETGRLKAWLEEQMELAMNAHPGFEKIGEGMWKRKGVG